MDSPWSIPEVVNRGDLRRSVAARASYDLGRDDDGGSASAGIWCVKRNCDNGSRVLKKCSAFREKRECVKAFQELLFAYLGNINHPFSSINQLLVPGFYRIAFFERCLRGYTWCQGLLPESPWHLVVGVHPWVLYGAIDGIIFVWFMCMIAKKSDSETYHWNLDEIWREIPWTQY